MRVVLMEMHNIKKELIIGHVGIRPLGWVMLMIVLKKVLCSVSIDGSKGNLDIAEPHMLVSEKWPH
jgi:hypothetical protein